MNKVWVLGAVLRAFCAPAFAGDILEQVKWLPLPVVKDAMYPPHTVDKNFSGELEIECRILDAEGHVDCDVPAIDPDYLYVAEYAASIVERYGQVDMQKTPGAAVGSRVRLTMNFAD